MTLYTQPGCGKCEQMKEFLGKNNIPFEEASARLLDDDPIGKTLKYLPVIHDGDYWIEGLIPGREFLAANYLHVRR